MSVNVVLVGMVCVAAAAFAATDSIVSSFPAPGTNCIGLTYDGGVLYVADAGTNRIVYRLNPTTGSVITSYSAPVTGGISGLTFAGGYLWLDTVPFANLYKCVPSNGSIVSSFTLTAISGVAGIGADANYIYVSKNVDVDPRVYRVSQTNGSVLASWVSYAKYPNGLERITHVPTATQVLLNSGNVDGWVYVYNLDGTRRAGEEFKLNIPASPYYYNGDVATLDDTHIFTSSTNPAYIWKLQINWNGQETPGVAPASFGRVKAIYR